MSMLRFSILMRFPNRWDFSQAAVRPTAARYDSGLGEFILPYDAVRLSASPGSTLLQFCESTYAEGATLGNWDRQALER